MTRLAIALCCLLTVACDKKSPPSPPVVEPPASVEMINGSERLGWDQPAADTVELAAIGYAVYVDGVRSLLTDVTCASVAVASRFPCTARMPSMPPGAHTLQLASFVNDGGVQESARSAALHVKLAAQTTAPADRSASPDRSAVGSRDVAGGVHSPADLAFAPDGRLFVAERGGRIRIFPPSALASSRQSASVGSAWPAGIPSEDAISLADTLGARGQLLALAVDPQVARSAAVFAIYTAPSRTGALTFTLARFHEVSGTLGAPAVLLDRVPASPSPSAALRFGPDGKLYAAFDDGGDPRRRQDPGSFNGKVLRLNADGTTPADARGGTPVWSAGYGSPVAMDWDPMTSTLWVADRAAGGSPFAFHRGAVMGAWSGRMVDAGTLRGVVAEVTTIAIGPDGAIYYGTTGALGRLAPDRGP